MESEQRIRRAKGRMKKLLNLKGRRKNLRLHQQALEDTTNRLRALDGLCGHCEEMYVKLFTKDRKKRVGVLCRSGHRPFIIYNDTPLGQEAECSDHKPSREQDTQVLSK